MHFVGKSAYIKQRGGRTRTGADFFGLTCKIKRYGR